jgi:Protein of unknown function (DUF3309)
MEQFRSRRVLAMSGRQSDREKHMLGTILVVLIILFLIGALPNWGHSRSWGYAPSGGLGLALVIVVALILMDRI